MGDNRLSVLIDLSTDKARSSLTNLRKDMAQADTGFQKLKVAGSGMLSSIKANAGQFAMLGATAVAGFGVKAIGAFQDTAQAAYRLGKATGLTTEQASRWIAVADDMGVSAEDLRGALAKIPKTLDSGKWAKYGIAVRDAGGRQRSTNDILLDTLGVLGKIPDETARARVGNELLGKGFATLAPLVGKTRDEYSRMLDAVSDGQVITEAEAETSEKLRQAQDRLKDALNEFTLAVGGLLAGPAGDLLGFFGAATEKAGALFDQLNKLPGAIGALEVGFNPILGAKSAWDSLTDSVTLHAEFAATLPAKYGPIGKAWELLTGWAQSAVAPIDDSAAAMRRQYYESRIAGHRLDELAKAAERAGLAHDTLLDSLDDRSAWLDMDDALASYVWGMNTGALKGRELERSLIGVKGKMVAFLDQLDNVPEVVRSRILADIDQGRLQSAKAQLDALERMRHAVVFVELAGPGRRYTGGTGPRQYLARGDDDVEGGRYLVGEHGPEEITLPRGARVKPAGKTARDARNAGTVVNQYVTIHSPIAQPSEIAAALAGYYRRNGRS